MKLYPAEAVNDDPTIGGIVFEFDSGIRKVLAWRQDSPILPALDGAKQFVATLIDTLLQGRHMNEVEFTNWASATAAVQKIIMDWNERQTSGRYKADLDRLANKGDVTDAIRMRMN